MKESEIGENVGAGGKDRLTTFSKGIKTEMERDNGFTLKFRNFDGER